MASVDDDNAIYLHDEQCLNSVVHCKLVHISSVRFLVPSVFQVDLVEFK